MTAPLWIKTPSDIDALVASLKGARALSIDTEADGLHHYPVKLCLVQVADDRGHGHLADPLALPTLAPLGPFFADPGVIKVLHAADNDLGYLKRLYGFTVAKLVDTSALRRPGDLRAQRRAASDPAARTAARCATRQGARSLGGGGMRGGRG